MDTVRIFDTTLRDGEQSPGATLTQAEKIEIARHLESMGVDIIEAGFPISSDGDFESVRAIAGVVTKSTVCGLARSTAKDIDRAGEAVKHAKKPRIHVFCATSKIHREHKLRKGKEEIIRISVESIRQARGYTADVEFSPEDASRTELEFLEEIVHAAIEAGATTINLPDTVGYATPQSYGEMFAHIVRKLPVIADKGVVLSSHCHNDLGLAVANSLSAIQNGARQVECTINGLGERAGNASLEEVVMAVRTRSDLFPVQTRIDATQIVPASKLVSQITGYPVQPNKAVVGANAFAHESGIHQDGVLKHRETYEIMRAEDVGWAQNKLVLGKHSGRNAFKSRLSALGIVLDSEEALNAAFARFKELADKKHEIFDEDLQALVSEDEAAPLGEHFKLVYSRVCSETGETPAADVTLTVGGVERKAASIGSGPVDATFKAIESIAASGAQLLLYSVNAITTGTDAQGEVTVRLARQGRIVNGNGADTDIVIASARAYLNALNKLQFPDRLDPQGDV